MKGNAAVARILIIVAAIILASSTNSWAHSSRPRLLAGIIQSIDREKHLITITSAKSCAPKTLLWTRQTQFLANWNFTPADTLKPGVRAVLYYKSPFIGKPFVTKVVWDNAETRK